MKNKILLVIPARKDSSFKGKNIYPCNNKPLVHYTLDAADKCGYGKILLTTDDINVMAEAEMWGAEVDKRPEHLCNAYATLDQVMFYIASSHNYQYYACLPPTSPLRNHLTLRMALNVFFSFLDSEKQPDSLVSVTEERRCVWTRTVDGGHYISPIVDQKKNRQEASPTYVSNGAIFIASRDIILKQKRKFGGRVLPYVMDDWRSVDVHSEDDIKLAEFYLQTKGDK